MDNIPEQFKCKFNDVEMRLLVEEFGCEKVCEGSLKKLVKRSSGIEECIFIYKCMSAKIELADLESITERITNGDTENLSIEPAFFADTSIVVDGKYYAGDYVMAMNFNDFVTKLLTLPVFKI